MPRSGRLFERLARDARPTLVVVTADHGESLGDHGELTHGVFAYEATLHVPFIVAEVDAGAAAIRAASTLIRPARHVDIVPTVLEAVGARGRTDCRARSSVSPAPQGDDRRPTSSR